MDNSSKALRALAALVALLLVIALIFYFPLRTCDECRAGALKGFCPGCGGKGQVTLWKSFHR